MFSVDDCIAIQVMVAFLDVGATAQWASHIACEVAEELRRDRDLQTLVLSKVVDKRGKPTIVATREPVPGGTTLHIMPIAEYRAKISAAFRERARQAE